MILYNKKAGILESRSRLLCLFVSEKNLGVAKGDLGAIIVGELGKMLQELPDFVLFATIAVLVGQAVRSITSDFTELLALLGLVKTRHDSTLL